MNVRRVNRREEAYGLSHILATNDLTLCMIWINDMWVCYETDHDLGPVTCKKCIRIKEREESR